jgi:hypothetical protein
MPRTKKPSATGFVSPDKNVKKEELNLDWGGWIDIRMTDELKDAFTKWFEASGNLFWSLLEEILADGLKASCSWDATNDCFVASLNGQGAKSINKRYSLTARSGDMYEAIMLVLFKHVVVLESDWGNYRFDNKYTANWG